MNSAEVSLAIDAGNTRIKVAEFQYGEIISFHSFDATELSALKHFLLERNQQRTIIASVRSTRQTNWLRQLTPGSVLFSWQLVKGITIDYGTPETLGIDRLCNALAASRNTEENALIIDLGTCVKYDFVDANKHYHGGAISPGLTMRFRAMHTQTAKLPLVDDYQKAELIGRNTADSLRSGVLNGMQLEIEGMIHAYRNKFGDVSVFITGGDAGHFEFPHINGIFADDLLTIKGLHVTLTEQ